MKHRVRLGSGRRLRMSSKSSLQQPPSVLETMRDAGKVLIVDDLQDDVERLKRVLRQDGYTICTARDGEGALEAAAREAPDIVLMDVMTPGADGFEVCRRFKEDPATRLTPIVLLTGLYAREHRLQGINAGADDFLTKPANPQELKARLRSLIRLKRYTDELDSAESVLLTLALTIEARDAYTQGHCSRLAIYATGLGADLGLGGDDLKALHRGAFLHDLGKIRVPDAVLLKQTELTPAEYELMKQHPIVGESLCGDLRALKPVRPIVRHHHERLDGTGYPDGLRGDAIPFLAQILSIVDVFDAVTTDRPYRQALAAREGYLELQQEARNGWKRPDLVERFIALVESGRFEGLCAAY